MSQAGSVPLCLVSCCNHIRSFHRARAKRWRAPGGRGLRHSSAAVTQTAGPALEDINVKAYKIKQLQLADMKTDHRAFGAAA